MSCMEPKLPIIRLKKHERSILEVVYRKNMEGERFSFRDVWFDARKQIPKGFRQEQMDIRLLRDNGEKINVIGIIALDKSRAVVAKIDKLKKTIWNLVQEYVKGELVEMEVIAGKADLSEKEASFLFTFVEEVGLYHSGSTNVDQTLRYKAISVKDNLNLFYNYNEYPGITKLVLAKYAAVQIVQPEYFTESEIIGMNYFLEKLQLDIRGYLDNKFEHIEMGQRASLEIMREEIDEMKLLLYKLSKKNWFETFAGKLL